MKKRLLLLTVTVTVVVCGLFPMPCCLADRIKIGNHLDFNPGNITFRDVVGGLAIDDNDLDGTLDGSVEYIIGAETGIPWAFHIWYLTDNITAWDAMNVQVVFFGTHLAAPHAGERYPMGCAPHSSKPVSLKDGQSVNIGLMTSQNHQLVGDPAPEGPHDDVYTLGIKRLTFDGSGNPPCLDAKPRFRIVARHGHDKGCPNKRKGGSIKAARANSPGSTLSYNALTGILSFDIGPVTLLDNDGATSEQTDPAYAGDPVLNAQISITNLEFQGINEDGLYEFSGGTVSLIDPNGYFDFEASFEKYVIDDTTNSDVLTSFAVLDNLRISDINSPNSVPSQFLSDFIDEHLFGQGLTEEQFMHWYIDLSFITEQNLAEQTNGFTTSVADEPADIIIVGCEAFDCSNSGSAIPTVSQWGLIIMAGLLLTAGVIAVRRRLKTKPL